MLKKVKDKSLSADKTKAKSKAEKFYDDAKTWDNEINSSLRASKNRAWTLAMLSMGLNVAAIGCLFFMLPLKTFEPYVVQVDKTTGYVEVARGLQKGDLSEDQAVTQANLVQYVTARETYDVQDLEENFNKTILMSADDAARSHQLTWTARNDYETPSEVYGYGTSRTVQIKSITFLQDKTAQVRFRIVQQTATVETKEDWVAIITFDYVQRPTKMLERFENPLGFKVKKYRANKEIL